VNDGTTRALESGMRIGPFLLGALLAALAPVCDARACGGCFSTSTSNSVVTDHKMILSLGREKTTLYDEMRYAGSPESFAWILPVAGEVTVALSAPALFGAVDALTIPMVAVPPKPCRGCGTKDNYLVTTANGVDDETDAVVGPYEVVRLHATDAGALDAWLAAHGFVVPPDVRSVVDAYVAIGADFIAMKLVPGATVRALRPVRVTMPSTVATLPLRMIAAGAGAQLGVTLVVVGEGRYEPLGAPTFVVRGADLTWDFATSISDYRSVHDALEVSAGPDAWEIQSSTSINAQTLLRRLVAANAMSDAGYDTDAGTATSAELARADIDALFAGAQSLRFTRLHARLARSGLQRDLTVVAAADQTVVDATREPLNFANPPSCDCDSVGRVSVSRGCGVALSRHDLVECVAFIGAVFAARRRRSRAAAAGERGEGE
jgi:hypothetical protein